LWNGSKVNNVESPHRKVIKTYTIPLALFYLILYHDIDIYDALYKVTSGKITVL